MTTLQTHPSAPPHTDRVWTARPCRAPRTDEAELMGQIAAGDHAAFEVLYCRYTPSLMSFLSRYLGSAALCEETLHEVLLLVWTKAADFNPNTRVSTWIFGIAHRKALQARATVVTPSPAATPAAPDRPPTDRPEDRPEARLLRQAQTREVERALARLPPEQRTALTLSYYQEYSYPEIAARTGYPVSTVRSQVRSACRRLAILLPQES
jgi:RNA polymerase sigma factor (sigma-70 family)